jgi:hypothetical protein
MTTTILNAIQLLVIVAIPWVLFTLIIHRIEKFTQHRLATRFGWKSILWTGWLGTPIHELSHVAMCLVFRHRIDDVALFEPDLESGRLGYVRHSFTKSNRFERIGNVFIGMAPLAGGAIALAILLLLFYPSAVQNALAKNPISNNPTSANQPDANSSLDPTRPPPSRSMPPVTNTPTGDLRPRPTMADSITQFFDATTIATASLLKHIFTRDNIQTKRFWCFLYLTLCIGSHMAPSRSDYHGARHGLLLLGGLIAATVLIISATGWDSVTASIAILSFVSPLLAIMMLAIILCVIAAAIVYVITMPFPVRYEIR